MLITYEHAYIIIIISICLVFIPTATIRFSIKYYHYEYSKKDFKHDERSSTLPSLLFLPKLLSK